MADSVADKLARVSFKLDLIDENVEQALNILYTAAQGGPRAKPTVRELNTVLTLLKGAQMNTRWAKKTAA